MTDNRERAVVLLDAELAKGGGPRSIAMAMDQVREAAIAVIADLLPVRIVGPEEPDFLPAPRYPDLRSQGVIQMDREAAAKEWTRQGFGEAAALMRAGKRDADPIVLHHRDQRIKIVEAVFGESGDRHG